MSAEPPQTIPLHPFMVGESIPGWCGGQFPLETADHTLRVEATGIDWVVFRDQDSGAVHFYEGPHLRLREDAAHESRKERTDGTR